MTVNNRQAALLTRVFSRKTFRGIICDGTSADYTAAVAELVTDATTKTNADCFRELYNVLATEYRDEYYFKNTLLNAFFPTPAATMATTALAELPIGRVIPDFITVSATQAHVFEIKTDLDSFERLNSQIPEYYKAFSLVSVVVSEQRLQPLQKRLQDTPVGICVLGSNGCLQTIKSPTVYTEALSKAAMFDTLRKSEREQVLLRHTGSLPDVTPVQYYNACYERFEALSVAIVQQAFFQALKERTNPPNEFWKIPHTLRSIAYFSRWKRSEYTSVLQFLNNEYHD